MRNKQFIILFILALVLFAALVMTGCKEPTPAPTIDEGPMQAWGYSGKWHGDGPDKWIGEDGGETWSQDHRVMLGWTASNTDSGYPSSVALDDGTIVTLYYQIGDAKRPRQGYSCNAVRCTEEDIVRSGR